MQKLNLSVENNLLAQRVADRENMKADMDPEGVCLAIHVAFSS
jgi:hypothetical protein